MHGAQGPSSMPVLQVDGPDHHVVAGGQGGHEDVESAALARPGRAGEQRVPAQERHAARLGVLERPEVDRLGDGPGGRARASRSPRRAGRCRARAVRTGWPCRRRSGRRGPRRGRCRAPIRSRVSARSRRRWSARGPGGARARQPHRSTLADWILEPGRPIALEMSGQAASVRCTRARARRRRCAHHGTARMSAPTPRTCGIGEVNGPSSAATASHPPAASTAAAA